MIYALFLVTVFIETFDSNLIPRLYLERILRKPEIDAFAEELKAHQVVNNFFFPFYLGFTSTELTNRRKP